MSTKPPAISAPLPANGSEKASQQDTHREHREGCQADRDGDLQDVDLDERQARSNGHRVDAGTPAQGIEKFRSTDLWLPVGQFPGLVAGLACVCPRYRVSNTRNTHCLA